MSDIDLSDFEGPVVEQKCKLALINDELDATQKAKLQAALDHETIAASRIVGALNSWGYRVGVTTVRNHRTKVCACQ